jgi:carbon monoxide dehydrogenase subunit G
MEFDSSFEVPLPPDRAWPVLLDIPRIVRCMPGAELVEIVDESTFKGKVTVKLGPVTLNFGGTVKFVEMDPANHRARAEARGNDAKGRGGATATVRFHLAPSAAGSRVDIHTDLSLTGAVAQYGRATGVVREFAAQITSEFAQRLRAQIEAEQPPSAVLAPSGARSIDQPSLDSRPESLSAARLLWKALVSMLRRLVLRRAD